LKELIDEHRLALREPKLRYYGDIDEIPVPNQEYTRHDFSPRWLWEQVLYEGIFEALGYAKNREPFLKLARNVRLEFLRERTSTARQNSSLILQALLFGIAGFLSATTGEDGESNLIVDELSKLWKENAAYYTRERFQRVEWTFFRLRPNNFPTRRLKAGAVLLQRFFDQDIVESIVRILKSKSTSRHRIRELRELIGVRENGYPALLGRLRIDDIIVNSILPLISLYGRVFKDPDIREAIQQIITGYPSLGENTITRFIRTAVPGIGYSLHGAMVQQGMLHLNNFYCTERRCKECLIGLKIYSPSAG
jgi:hypothetical protein